LERLTRRQRHSIARLRESIVTSRTTIEIELVEVMAGDDKNPILIIP
jgi:hypothetical protein